MDEFEGINKLAMNIIQEGIDTGKFRSIDTGQATQYLLTTLLAYVMK